MLIFSQLLRRCRWVGSGNGINNWSRCRVKNRSNDINIMTTWRALPFRERRRASIFRFFEQDILFIKVTQLRTHTSNRYPCNVLLISIFPVIVCRRIEQCILNFQPKTFYQICTLPYDDDGWQKEYYRNLDYVDFLHFNYFSIIPQRTLPVR